MRKQLATLFILATTLCIADVTPLPPVGDYIKKAAPLESPVRKGSFYLRAAADAQTQYGANFFPGFGLGYRKSFGHSGIDISFNYNEGADWAKSERFITWTTPKVSYLYYFTPKTNTCLYSGIGMGWGGCSHKKYETAAIENDYYYDDAQLVQKFTGLIPHLTLGVELLRTSILTSFIELNLSQPVIPKYFKGESKPGPIAELSVGAGF